MAPVVDRYLRYARRRNRRAASEHESLDIQGLQMMASIPKVVLTAITKLIWTVITAKDYSGRATDRCECQN